MTRTVQPRSTPLLNKMEAEDNKILLLHIFDSLNNLYEKLSRLDYLMQRKSIEQILSPKCTGEKR
ncbi:MAG: hypothetical protein LBV17_05890 [Treponema sp.]|jgi:hypothetical protein|nr:hypothetical protein [Treponema sp.]